MTGKKPVEFYLVRHGQSQANVDKSLYTKIPDSQIELTELGWQQAAATGAFLAQRFIEKGETRPIILRTSGHMRARQTTQCIYNALTKAGFKVHVRESDMLTEQSLGQVAGRPHQEWSKAHPVYAELFAIAREKGALHFLIPPGGEARLATEARVRVDLNSIYRYRASHGDGPVILVNHGETSRQISKVLLGQTHEQSDAEPPFGNAEVRLIARPPASPIISLGDSAVAKLFNTLLTPKLSPHPLLDYGFIWKNGQAHAPVARPRTRTTDLFKNNTYGR